MTSKTTGSIRAITLALFTCAAVHAQDKKNSITVGGKDYPLTVANMNEWRYHDSKSGNCSFNINCDLPISEWMPSRLDIETALDDTGRNMVKEKRARLENDLSSSLMNTNFSISVRLNPSARSAKVIRELKGFVYLQNKGASEASKVTLHGFTIRPGEFIGDAELKKRGIDVAYINAESYDEKGGKLIADILDPPFTNKSGAAGAKIENPMKNAAAGMMKGLVSIPGTMFVLIKDPSSKVIKVVAADTHSGKTTVAQSSVNGMYIIQNLESLASDDKKPQVFDELRIYLKDETLAEKAPFILNDIPLP